MNAINDQTNQHDLLQRNESGQHAISRRIPPLQYFTKGIVLLLFVYGFVLKSYADGAKDGQKPIEGITFENFPKMDGSTSTKSLKTLIAAKLLGIRAEWEMNFSGEREVFLHRDDIPDEYTGGYYAYFEGEHLKVSKTHGAFINLLENNTDIIFVQSKMSPEEKMYADELGVTLIEMPIALDAFVFIVNKENPVRDLTVDQIQRIYTGKLTNWQDVGGNDTIIKPYVRPGNSGSQETMQSLVMGSLEIAQFPESNQVAGMEGVFPEIYNNTNAICYTFNAYKEKMVLITNEHVPKIAVNGVYPGENTIKNETYPFTSKVYVVIRSDIDKNSITYKIYEWLRTGGASDMISECGFVALDGADDANAEINQNELQVFPNPTSEGFYINGLDRPVQLAVFDFSGRQLLSKEITDGEFVDIAHLSKGIYLVKVNDSIAKVIKK